MICHSMAAQTNVMTLLILCFKALMLFPSQVPNYLPSLSAAIGDYTPERYIWRLGIALHSFGRYMVAAIYMYFYTQLSIGKKSWFFSLAVLNFFLNLLEIFSLLVLSYVSSTENFGKFFLSLLSKLSLYNL